MDRWIRWRSEDHNQEGLRIRFRSGKPPRGNWQSTVPAWEKKFCWEVGRVPWGKLLETKKLIHVYQNILKWDDSASEEAFRNAKARYWARLNGIPCDLPLPDPNAHVDNVDWSSDIDPELILDLDRDFVVADDFNKGERVLILGEMYAKSQGLTPDGWGEEADGKVELAESYIEKLCRPHDVWVDPGGGWDAEDAWESKVKENVNAGDNGWESKAEENGYREENAWNCDSGWKAWETKVDNFGKYWQDGGYNSNYNDSGRYMSRYKTIRFHGDGPMNNQWESINDSSYKSGNYDNWNNNGGYKGNIRENNGRNKHKATGFYGNHQGEREYQNGRRKENSFRDQWTCRPINHHGAAKQGNDWGL